ncbi:hypothetical protein ACTMTF_15355 [Nonomuraea sp. ZG12]|uniref:hypothetical protein n=1 Tax=Nonomuraea sp. ZG12 TaxID=3452207 RepID=UPI003F8CBD08
MKGLDGKRYLTLQEVFDDLLMAEDMKDVRTIYRNAYRMRWFRQLVAEAGEKEGL